MAGEIEKRMKALHHEIARLERKRKSRIFCFIQGEDDHICHPTLRMILKHQDRFQGIDTLEILLHSTGGHPDIAYQAVNFFRRHCKRLNVLVPFCAKSAATLICLGADSIYMGELAELGPLDVQIQDPMEKGQLPFSPLDEFKSMEFLREYATEMLDYLTLTVIHHSGMSVKEALHETIPATTGIMQPLYARIDPSKVGGYRRSLAVGEEYAKRILERRKCRNTEELTQKLVWGYPNHGFVIDYEEATQLGLPVKVLDSIKAKKFLESIQGLLETGVPYYGFVKESIRKKAPAKSGRQTLPASISGSTQKGGSGTAA